MAAGVISALVSTGDPEKVERREFARPVPEPGELLVAVRAISVNRGELHRLGDLATAGWRPGWDFAGEVLDSRSGTLTPGTRVFGMCADGSWAEQIAVPASQLARVPDGLSLAQAAALPVAGLTALRTLRLAAPMARGRVTAPPGLGGLAGCRVLVTGAAGGVGRFAVRLAALAGAEVVAVSRRPDGLRTLGAAVVLDSPERLADGRGYDVVLESVGGASLGAALALAASGGQVVSYGNSSLTKTSFLVNDFYPNQAVLRGFFLLRDREREPVGADLRVLADLAVTGRLPVEIAEETGWDEVGRVLRRLRDRTIAGKAVLRLP